MYVKPGFAESSNQRSVLVPIGRHCIWQVLLLLVSTCASALDPILSFKFPIDTHRYQHFNTAPWHILNPETKFVRHWNSVTALSRLGHYSSPHNVLILGIYSIQVCHDLAWALALAWHLSLTSERVRLGMVGNGKMQGGAGAASCISISRVSHSTLQLTRPP